MKTAEIQKIIERFESEQPEGGSDLKDRKPVTQWLPRTYKEKYDALQDQTGKRFGKMAREVLKALIDSQYTPGNA